jgi:hypothetical protein
MVLPCHPPGGREVFSLVHTALADGVGHLASERPVVTLAMPGVRFVPR